MAFKNFQLIRFIVIFSSVLCLVSFGSASLNNAMAAISHGAKQNERIFPMTGNAVRLAWERLLRTNDIRGLRFHDFRHEATSRMFDEGMTVPQVAAISGHRTVSMLFRYAHVL